MSLFTSLPDGLPWEEQQAFVLLDGATISDLPARIKQLSPTASTFALYDQPPFAALGDLSPLLLAVQGPDDALARFYLQHADLEWGVLLFSTAPMHSVTEHLRKLITVKTPGGSTVILRLADAAVVQALFDGSDPRLFGPLSCVVSADSVNAVWHCQRPRHAECPALPVPYRLSDEQDAALDQVDRRRLLLELDTHLRRHFPTFHAEQTTRERWPMLERMETQASALGLSGQADLCHYANIIVWLNDSTLAQHPHIQQLLHKSSLQPPAERVVLAATLAQQWASEQGRS